jgi:hypothetical protein
MARLKDGGRGWPEIIEFSKSSKRNFSFDFKDTVIHLVKVINPRTNEATLFATNLERSGFKN